MLLIFYEIYFIKYYFFRIIHVNNFILSQLRPTPTTYVNIITDKAQNAEQLLKS